MIDQARGTVADVGIMNLVSNVTALLPLPPCLINQVNVWPSAAPVGLDKVTLSVRVILKIPPAVASVATSVVLSITVPITGKNALAVMEPFKTMLFTTLFEQKLKNYCF